jgi:hypothetical protein
MLTACRSDSLKEKSQTGQDKTTTRPLFRSGSYQAACPQNTTRGSSLVLITVTDRLSYAEPNAIGNAIRLRKVLQSFK